MQNIDIKKLVNNIKALAKARTIKITDLEKNAEVSQGYLSRIESSDYSTRPNIVIVKSMADTLGVGVNVLLEYDLANMADDVIMMLNKIEIIKDKTDADILDWDHTTQDYIKQEYRDSRISHPLFKYHSNGKYEYASLFNPNITSVEFEILSLKYNNNSYYLTKFKFMNFSGFYDYLYEFYVDSSENSKCLGICAGFSTEPIGNALGHLYDSAYDNSRRLKLSNDIKRCLEDF